MRGHGYSSGFSLMEALIALLVVSFGMLGLGQLQARLWAGGGDLQRLNHAYMAAENSLLVTELNTIFKSRHSLEPSTHPGYTYTLNTHSADSLITTRITLDWQQSRRNATLTLGVSVMDDPSSAGSRWLLPAR